MTRAARRALTGRPESQKKDRGGSLTKHARKQRGGDVRAMSRQGSKTENTEGKERKGKLVKAHQNKRTLKNGWEGNHASETVSTKRITEGEERIPGRVTAGNRNASQRLKKAKEILGRTSPRKGVPGRLLHLGRKTSKAEISYLHWTACPRDGGEKGKGRGKKRERLCCLIRSVSRGRGRTSGKKYNLGRKRKGSNLSESAVRKRILSWKKPRGYFHCFMTPIR